jgi:hypothetical protein
MGKRLTCHFTATSVLLQGYSSCELLKHDLQLLLVACQAHNPKRAGLYREPHVVANRTTSHSVRPR